MNVPEEAVRLSAASGALEVKAESLDWPFSTMAAVVLVLWICLSVSGLWLAIMVIGCILQFTVCAEGLIASYQSLIHCHWQCPPSFILEYI